MTHREKLLALLEEFGITPHPASEWDMPEAVFLVQGHGNFQGYGGFYALFDFDEDGKFIEAGAWEGW